MVGLDTATFNLLDLSLVYYSPQNSSQVFNDMTKTYLKAVQQQFDALNFNEVFSFSKNLSLWDYFYVGFEISVYVSKNMQFID